jgi:hypothetical protein
MDEFENLGVPVGRDTKAEHCADTGAMNQAAMTMMCVPVPAG